MVWRADVITCNKNIHKNTEITGCQNTGKRATMAVKIKKHPELGYTGVFINKKQINRVLASAMSIENWPKRAIEY